MKFARRPKAYTARLRYVLGVILVLVGSNELFAQKQEKLEPALGDVVIPDDVLKPAFGDVVFPNDVAVPGVAIRLVNSKPQLQKQMRGLIQNELTIIGDICGLELKQQQALADLAEAEWKSKTNASIVKRTQEHVYGTIDLDGLAERIVRLWLESVANKEQLEKYDLELADRMKWRQKAVISKVLDTLETKLNLSGVQMDQIEVILNEKWKDRWYRSLEATFDNASLLPEIRPTWIAPVLSESQRAALSTRDQQQRFGTMQVSADSPSLEMEERFRVGAAVSGEPLENEPKDNLKKADKEIEKPKAVKEGASNDEKP